MEPARALLRRRGRRRLSGGTWAPGGLGLVLGGEGRSRGARRQRADLAGSRGSTGTSCSSARSRAHWPRRRLGKANGALGAAREEQRKATAAQAKAAGRAAAAIASSLRAIEEAKDAAHRSHDLAKLVSSNPHPEPHPSCLLLALAWP